MEARGELKKGTAERWAKHTKNIKKLPERVGHKRKYARLKKKLGVKGRYRVGALIEKINELKNKK